MAPEDSKAPFMRIPWTAALLSRSDFVFRTPGSRQFKPTGEDSLFATTLRTPLTLGSCISAHIKPQDSDPRIDEVLTFVTIGTGLDGHPGILHGGIVASLLDEGMGILQTANHERDYLLKAAKRRESGDAEIPAAGLGSFTAFLNIKYLRPVKTSAAVVVVAWYQRREGRKDWVEAEVRQWSGDDDGEGELVVCARAGALFVVPREKKL